jgi:ATP-dependent DNA ligase
MPLARLHAPFDSAEWLFEPKLDGSAPWRTSSTVPPAWYRGMAISSSPSRLTAAVAAILPGRDAALDGEIVHLGPDGVPLFYELMRRRAPQHNYAFDLLWLDARDLRGCRSSSARPCCGR